MKLDQFNEKQMALLKEIGQKLNITIEINKDYSDDEVYAIDDEASDHLVMHGFDEGYEINEVGILCENIMDYIYDHDPENFKQT